MCRSGEPRSGKCGAVRRGSSGLRFASASVLQRGPCRFTPTLAGMASITGVRVPIEWSAFGWDVHPRFNDVVFSTGDPAWAWTPVAPAFGVEVFTPPAGSVVDGFVVDHVVLLVPSLDAAIATMERAGATPRLRMRVKGRPAAFFRVGPVLEVIESPVRSASIFGVALATDRSLESLALEWRAMGLSVGQITDAVQPGRRIMTIHDLDAGLAVMSMDRAVGHPS